MILLKFSSYRLIDAYVNAVSALLKMPKYAVAVGRKVGIYDTYAECQEQTLNYPKAKFKKFNTIEDAEAFIKQYANIEFNNRFENMPPMAQTSKENLNKPDLIKLEKISPSNNLFVISNKINGIEERLNKFISDTTSLLENLVARVKSLEKNKDYSSSSSCCSNAEPPRKKTRTGRKPLVNGLVTNEEGFTIVFTDGACSNNGRYGAQAGLGVWFNDGHSLNISAPVQGPATNNNAEIQAARVAVTQAYHAGVRKLAIHTDSKFVISCITQWINKWKKNDWKLSSGGDVKNKDELIKLDDAIQLLDAVQWTYVKGHKGIRGNEMADKLAREGASRYKTNITYSRNAELHTVKFFDPGSSDEDFARKGASRCKTNISYSRNAESDTAKFFDPGSSDEDFKDL